MFCVFITLTEPWIAGKFKNPVFKSSVLSISLKESHAPMKILTFKTKRIFFVSILFPVA